MVKNPPGSPKETQVRSLGQEGPLEKEMATHSSIVARRILWTEEAGGLSLWGHKELDLTLQLSTHVFTYIKTLLI